METVLEEDDQLRNKFPIPATWILPVLQIFDQEIWHFLLNFHWLYTFLKSFHVYKKNRPSTNTCVTNWFIDLSSQWSFSSKSSKYHNSQTIRARDLTFLDNVHHMSCVMFMCHVSCVMCKVSPVTCHMSNFFLKKVYRRRCSSGGSRTFFHTDKIKPIPCQSKYRRNVQPGQQQRLMLPMWM